MTLASTTPNVQKIESAWFRAVNADATLQGSSYLGAAGKVVVGMEAPEDIDPPRLHLAVSLVTDPDVQTARGTLFLKAVVETPTDGLVADRVRLGAIAGRAAELVVGRAMTSDDDYRFFDSWTTFHGSAEVDPENPKVAYQDVRVAFRCRRIA